jgi:SAM-dependent methyltransferase
MNRDFGKCDSEPAFETDSPARGVGTIFRRNFMIPAPSSITHQHLLSVIASEADDRSSLKVVDIGCGGGAMMRYLRQSLPALLPACLIEVSGFDVSDFAPPGNTNLESDTLTVRTGEPWPYGDKSVDIMISNQVIEHVDDGEFFFSEISRCLKRDGVSVHLFPLKHVLWEDHVAVPLAHRFSRPGFIRAMSKIVSTERGKNFGRGSGKEPAECAADYLNKYTAYRTRRELTKTARSHGLRISFDYTPYFYTSKLRAVTGRAPKLKYSPHPMMENLAFFFLRYVSSITLVLRHS